MMQSEFENLLGHSVDYSEYEKIEAVYMCFEKMTKQEIADLYKRDSQFVVNILYNHVMDIDKTNDKRNAQLDELQKGLDYCNKSLDKITHENKQLQIENDLLKDIIVKYQVEDFKNKNHIEELETQLHQYKALFTDMEKNITVNLYKTLLGDTE